MRFFLTSLIIVIIPHTCFSTRNTPRAFPDALFPHQIITSCMLNAKSPQTFTTEGGSMHAGEL